MESGKYYLFAASWDWTYVGRLRGIKGTKLVIDHFGYFTRTGTTFDKLCRTGFVKDTQFHPCGNGLLIDIDGTKLFPWHAKTNWPNPDEGQSDG
jgi:hypothetical protein